MKAQSHRNYPLDFVKIVATFIIIFHHFQQVLDVKYVHGINFYGGKFNFGFVVELFFILSGYFMLHYISKINEGESFLNFFKRRYFRLFPVLAFGTVAYQIFAFIYLKVTNNLWLDKGFSFWSTVISCLGLQDGWVFQNPGINNPAWYVSVLLLCYCIFYFLTWLSKKISVSCQWLYVGMIFLGIGIQTAQLNLPFLNFDASRGYIAFFTGLVLANIFSRINITEKNVTAALLVFTGSVLLFWLLPDFMSSGTNYTLTFLTYPALLIVFEYSSIIRRLVNWRAFGFLSKISYSVYIMHLPVLILWSLAAHQFSQISGVFYSLPGMFLFSVLCFGVGTLVYFLVERPFRYLNKA